MKVKVEQITKAEYICDICNAKYDTEEKALACEQGHAEKAKKRIADQKRHEEYVKEEAKKQEFLKQNPPKFKRGDIVKYTNGSCYCVMRHFVAGEYKYRNWYVLQKYGWYDQRHGEHHEDKTIEENLTLVATKEAMIELRDDILNKLKSHGINTLNDFGNLLGTVQFTVKHPYGSLDDWD